MIAIIGTDRREVDDIMNYFIGKNRSVWDCTRLKSQMPAACDRLVVVGKVDQKILTQIEQFRVLNPQKPIFFYRFGEPQARFCAGTEQEITFSNLKLVEKYGK